MSEVANRTALVRNDSYFRMRGVVEEFFYDEAEHIDNRRFEAWLDMLHDDLRYFMPIRRNMKFGQQDEFENTREDEGMSWFNEDKWTVGKRVEQILTGLHYAEEPLSRTSHLITNVQILSATPSIEAPDTLNTSCRFLVYQNRGEYETAIFVGKRYDTLVTSASEWKLLRREVILDQNVLLAKNLSTFF